MIRFVIPGEPQGKGRPRFSRAGNFVTTYTPEKTERYEALVKAEYRRQCPGQRFEDNEPLDMRVFAFYTIPKSAGRAKRAAMEAQAIRPTKKPDWDNIGKVIADSLNRVAYWDDAQVVDSQVRKFYSLTPRVEVVIRSACTDTGGTQNV